MEQIQDVLKVAAKAYKLLMENKKVRVLDIRLKPGEKAPMHNHPSGHVVYVMNNAKFKLTFPDGKIVNLILRPDRLCGWKRGRMKLKI